VYPDHAYRAYGESENNGQVAKWRPPAGIEPPAWVRVYDPDAWPNIYAWTDAAGDWFDVNHVDSATRWEWILAIPDEEPFDPYG
jgi:hypothetical protein